MSKKITNKRLENLIKLFDETYRRSHAANDALIAFRELIKARAKIKSLQLHIHDLRLVIKNDNFFM